MEFYENTNYYKVNNVRLNYERPSIDVFSVEETTSGGADNVSESQGLGFYIHVS